MLRVCLLSLHLLIVLTNSRFGAVLEEFEVRDVLESIFYTKPELNMAF
jgi:hypothetical protein